MRIILLPITRSRTLLYCVQPAAPAGTSSGIGQRIIDKSTALWAQWQAAPGGWKKRVTVYGDSLLSRIPADEWSLRTVPSLRTVQKQLGDAPRKPVELLFPASFLRQEAASDVLTRLAARQQLHRRWALLSIAGMPLVMPFALVPV